MSFSIGVFRPLTEADPPDQLELIGPDRLASVGVEQALPGGVARITADFRVPPDRGLLAPGAHIVAYWSGAYVGEAMLRVPKLVRGRLAGFEAQGYAQSLLDINPWTTAQLKTDGEVPQDMGVVAAMVIQQADPRIRLGQPWGDPQGQITLSELDGRSPWQILGQIGTATGWDVILGPGRVARFVPRALGEVADYEVGIEQIDDWEADQLDIFTRITATYTPPVPATAPAQGAAVSSVRRSTRPFIDHVAEVRLGRVAAVVKDAGSVSQTYAEAWAQNQLRAGPVPTVRASIGPVAALPTPARTATPGPLVGVGEWVLVQPAAEFPAQCIIGTSVDTNGMLTATLGALPNTPAANLALARRTDQNLARDTNPLTGARA